MAEPARKLGEIEADWDRKSVSAAIEAARSLLGEGINGRVMVSSLSDVEWTWICAAAIFAWIKLNPQQAVEEGTSTTLPIRTMKSRDPEPWEYGAIESVLPALGNIELPWTSPVGEWPKQTIILFAWSIHRLIGSALAARDEGAKCTIAKRLSKSEIEREASAANGGSLMSREELNDDIPF